MYLLVENKYLVAVNTYVVGSRYPVGSMSIVGIRYYLVGSE